MINETEEDLPTAANIWHSHGGIEAAYLVGKEKMTEKFMEENIAQVEELVRRSDIPQHWYCLNCELNFYVNYGAPETPTCPLCGKDNTETMERIEREKLLDEVKDYE